MAWAKLPVSFVIPYCPLIPQRGFQMLNFLPQPLDFREEERDGLSSVNQPRDHIATCSQFLIGLL